MKNLLFIPLLFLFNNQIHLQTMKKNWVVVFPHGCDTSLHTQEGLMKNRLVEFINIGLDSLNYSIESLKLLDEGLNNVGFKKNSEFTGLKLKQNEDDLFSAILFYFGETLKRQIEGEWQYDQVKDSDSIFVPCIISLQGIEYDFYGYIEEYFFRNDNGRTLLPTMNSILYPEELFQKVEKWDNWIFPRLDEKG